MLEFIKEYTEAICLAAVKQTRWVLQYVEEQTTDICLKAVNSNIQSFSCIQYANINNNICNSLDIIKYSISII